MFSRAATRPWFCVSVVGDRVAQFGVGPLNCRKRPLRLNSVMFSDQPVVASDGEHRVADFERNGMKAKSERSHVVG
ncbi:MAG: hypothetical protein ACK515_09530 [bacterium]|jgi:hypothetical protein